MRKPLLGIVCATALTLAASGTARATGPYTTTQRSCYDRIAKFTTKLIDAVHDEIRVSIGTNMRALKSLCGGPNFVCAGGANNGKTCTGNAFCGSAGNVPFQCQSKANAGILGAVNTAKKNLRTQIASCTPSDLNALYGTGGNARCPDPSNPANGMTADEVYDCILRTAIGEIDARQLRGNIGEILGTGAPDVAVDSPMFTKACGVVLGGLTHVGSVSTASTTFIRPVALDPLGRDGCTDGTPLCPVKSLGAVGNLIDAPLQTFAGAIPICLETRAADAGNGTPAAGRIDLSTGLYELKAPVDLSIHIGETCPICNAITLRCNTGPHLGLACNNPGATDVACPATQVPTVPIIHQPLSFSTEMAMLAVQPNNPGGGVTNPVGTFCGYCDVDQAVGCGNDSDCVNAAVCGGGQGCCVFGTNQGAFADANAHFVQVEGVRNPYLPQLVSLSCTGRSGDNLVDSAVGLPGPLRSVQTRLTAYEY